MNAKNDKQKEPKASYKSMECLAIVFNHWIEWLNNQTIIDYSNIKDRIEVISDEI